MIITISREFGSGGRVIGHKLSEKLGIPCYDRKIIDKAAEESGLTVEFIEDVEKHRVNFWESLTAFSTEARSYYHVPVRVDAFQAQAKVIQEIAQKGDCIIVGRCADHVLRDRTDLLRLFVCGDEAARLAYAVKQYGHEPGDAKGVARIDKARGSNYKLCTGKDWGQAQNYDLCINTTRFGIDASVDAILALVNTMGKD